MDKIENPIAKIMAKYRKQYELTYRAFASALNEKIENKISHVAITNWEAGRNEPATDFLVLLILRYNDWRFDFSAECLAAKNPAIWGTDGAIWEAGRTMEKRKEGDEAAPIPAQESGTGEEV